MSNDVLLSDNQFQPAKITIEKDTVKLSGSWTWQCINENFLDELTPSRLASHKTILVDGLNIEGLDMSGAYFLRRMTDWLESHKCPIQNMYLQAKHQRLYELTESQKASKNGDRPHFSPIELTCRLGYTTFQYLKDALAFTSFLGEVAAKLCNNITHPKHIQLRMILDVIYLAGYQAIGIVCLLCFLIGVVLTYQMGAQLSTYGANIYVVQLLGISLLREFAPLITAIIVAGRSGSAFAAQIGTMKLQQELDALKTLGISPISRLVLPSITGLLIAMPALVIFADIASVIGGMIMSDLYLNVSYTTFLQQFGQNVPISNYVIGLVKTPVFALLIATVGCYRGLCVEGHSASIGQQTTKAVVYAIFMIIIADALFSIMFSTVGI